jgi:hypothetical protein
MTELEVALLMIILGLSGLVYYLIDYIKTLREGLDYWIAKHWELRKYVQEEDEENRLG